MEILIGKRSNVGFLALICMLFVAPSEAKLPYQDASLSAEQRTEDLLLRMTLEEKIGQMCQYVGIEHSAELEGNMTIEELNQSDAHGFYPDLHSSQIPALIKSGEIGSFLHVVTVSEANHLQSLAKQSRLGIPLIIGIDAIHGNAMVSGSTVYPAPLAMASTWNLDLVRKASRETALEMRATGSHWTFTPNVDVARDARWGRVGETFGEDPFLVGEMGVATIEGLQLGDFTGPDKVLANAKHFIAGGSPINGLNFAPMDLSERSLREVYLPPFKKAIDAGVFTFMAAHNEVNGVPSHSSRYLLTDILRKEWGFEGFVVSDWMDIERIHTIHRVAETPKEAVFQAVYAGMDMHMHGPGFLEPLAELVKEGRIEESRIDASVRPILIAKFKLGLFENALVEASASAIVNSTPHRLTALQMARQSIVLLENRNNTLPLSPASRIFVTGPNANNHTILGDWVLPQPEKNVITVVEGLKQVLGKKAQLDYLNVGDQVKNISQTSIDQARERAAKSDIAIVVVGQNPLRYDSDGKTSGENVGRSNINLVGRQLDLVKAVYSSGKPTIVVFVGGRPIAEPWIAENSAAFVQAWEPGALGGLALAEILLGHVNPSGKLPITMPYSVGHIQAIYNHKPSSYKHKYTDAPTRNLYDFGFGLGYSEFLYGQPKLAQNKINADSATRVVFTLSNVGRRRGTEVVQLYIRDEYSQVSRPVKELKGFQRVSLAPGESREVNFDITSEMLAYYNLDMKKIVEPGAFQIMIGSSSSKGDLKTTRLIVEK
ncbi:MAG: glycoside hydrolase family 3 N-terminal domain-containing protein [Pseudomonadales bacterium]